MTDCVLSRRCCRPTMWWPTRSTVMRRWGWPPHPLHLTWTATPQTAPTETWTWRTSPESAWSSSRRTQTSRWYTAQHIYCTQAHIWNEMTPELFAKTLCTVSSAMCLCSFMQGITLKMNDSNHCIVARIMHGGMIHRQGILSPSHHWHSCLHTDEGHFDFFPETVWLKSFIDWSPNRMWTESRASHDL